MNQLHILTHEIGTECNLAAAHSHVCPVLTERYKNVDKSKVLSNEQIVENVRYAYSLGFRGVLAWQFYCEPLLYMDRIEDVFSKIERVVPHAKHILWSNGTLIDRKVAINRLKTFHSVIISNHEPTRDWSCIKPQIPQMTLISGRFDRRLKIGGFSRKRCVRPYAELPIDYYGHHRLCCGDYLATASELNVHKDGFPKIVERYLHLRSLLEQEPLPDGVPEVCFRCCIRSPALRHSL